MKDAGREGGCKGEERSRDQHGPCGRLRRSDSPLALHPQQLEEFVHRQSAVEVPDLVKVREQHADLLVREDLLWYAQLASHDFDELLERDVARTGRRGPR